MELACRPTTHSPQNFKQLFFVGSWLLAVGSWLLAIGVIGAIGVLVTLANS